VRWPNQAPSWVTPNSKDASGLGCFWRLWPFQRLRFNVVFDVDVLLASRENSFDRLDDLLRRFWEVESCAEPIIRATKEELDCESHFVRHVVRLPAGDYSVRLPGPIAGV